MIERVKNPHLWIIILILGFCTVPQYAEPLGIFGETSIHLFLTSTRYTALRVLYLVPIIYAALTLGPRTGIVIALTSTVLMLPRALSLSPNPLNASLETAMVTLFGLLSCFYLKAQKEVRTQKEKTLSELGKAHSELQSHVQLLERERKRLNALNELSSLITQSLEVEQVLSSAIQKVAEVMNAEVVLIFVVNQDNKELDLFAHQGVSQEFTSKFSKMKIGEGLNGEVAASGKSIVVEDTSQEKGALFEGIYAQLIVPLKFKSAVTGTLCIGVRQPRQFQRGELELLTIIGNAIGVALENARLYVKQREIAADLQISERNYRTLFEGANDAIWIQDIKGRITAANEAAARLSGYSVDELKHMSVQNFLHENGLTIAKQVRASLLKEQIIDQPYEQVMFRRDDSEATLKLSTSLMKADDGSRAFYHIARDITEEKRLQDNMHFYIQQSVRAQEEERKRIARELHDGIVQILVSVSRQLDNLIRKKNYLPSKDIFNLKDLRTQIDQGLQEVRRLSQDLRPSLLDDLGLVPAIRSLLKNLQDYDGIGTKIKVLGRERRCSPEVETVVFRIVQEALSNIRRHAKASMTWVEVHFNRDRIRLIIKDNGQGFDLPEQLEDLPRSGKLGLAGMHERTQLLGGSLQIRSIPGKMTTLIADIPSQIIPT